MKVYMSFPRGKPAQCTRIVLESIAHSGSSAWGEYFAAIAKFRKIKRILEGFIVKVQSDLHIKRNILIAQEDVFDSLRVKTIVPPSVEVQHTLDPANDVTWYDDKDQPLLTAK